MIKLFRPIAMTLLSGGLMFFALGPVRGQEAFDFDRLDAEVADPEPADDTTDISRPADEDAPARSAAPAVAAEESTVVDAIRQSDPQTPQDLMRAIDQLIRVERSDAAAEYLDRLVKLSLNDEALAQLYREFGTATMIRLARTRELAPQASDFALAVMRAGQRMLQDPRRLAKWVEQLGAEDRSVRYRAAEQLLRAGPRSVPPLVEGIVTDKASPPRLRDWAFAVLERLGRDALEPLYGYLASDAPAARVAAITAVGRIGSSDSLAYLVAPLFAPRAGEVEMQAAAQAWQQILKQMPDRDAALELLAHEADRAYRGQAGTAPDPDDQVTRWTWSAPTQQPVATSMRTADAAALKAARLYEDVVRLRPDDRSAVQRYLISRLEVDASLGGVDRPLRRGAGTAFDLVQQTGDAAANRLLQQALDDQHEAAAIGVAEVLGEIMPANALQRSWPEPAAAASPLVQALSHANRRVRFAAAQAIAKIHPSGSFDGAGRLADVLEYFATSRGHRAVVIAHPNPVMARDVAGMLASRGFRTATVSSAHALEKAATSTADVEFLLISDALNDASLWSTLEALRVHPKTARLPIGILARPATQNDAARTAEAHARVQVWSEKLDDQTLDLQLPQLLALADRDATDSALRLQQAQSAVRMLDRLVSGSPPAELDLVVRAPALVDALNAPELIDEATHLLSKIASRDAQRSLVDLASEAVRPQSQRETAAKAFRQSAAQHGVLLSQAQIERQYQRYNQSRELDRPTQVLLGSILDAIEDPGQAEPVER